MRRAVTHGWTTRSARTAAVLVLCIATATAGCHRQVNTASAPASASAVASISLVNGLAMPVNVYVSTGEGQELFLGQVPAHSTQALAARGVAPDKTITLKATTADGANTYSKQGVTLGTLHEWRVP